MGHAAAFFLGIGLGAVTSVALMAEMLWRYRNGSRPRSRSRRLILLALTFTPAVVITFSMPDFKTGLLAWIGFGVGMMLAKAVTLPMMYLGGKRIEERLKRANVIVAKPRDAG